MSPGKPEAPAYAAVFTFSAATATRFEQRLRGIAGELDQRLGVLRRFGDIRVERAAEIVALQLEELGRRLDGGQVLQRGGRALERLAAIFGGVLAQALEALGGDAAGLDQRLDVALGEVIGFLDQLGRLLDGGLGTVVPLGEQSLGLVGGVLDGQGHLPASLQLPARRPSPRRLRRRRGDCGFRGNLGDLLDGVSATAWTVSVSVTSCGAAFAGTGTGSATTGAATIDSRQPSPARASQALGAATFGAGLARAAGFGATGLSAPVFGPWLAMMCLPHKAIAAMQHVGLLALQCEVAFVQCTKTSKGAGRRGNQRIRT